MKRRGRLLLLVLVPILAALAPCLSDDTASIATAVTTTSVARTAQPQPIFTNLAPTVTPSPMTPIRIGIQRQDFYRGSTVRITNLAAQLLVESYDQSVIELTVNGPNDQLIQAVSVITDSTSITIHDPTLVMQDVGFTHPEGYDGLKFKGKPREFIFMTVRVPKGTPVIIDHFIGYAEVGDDVGPLDASLAGQSILFATHLVSATLTQEGAGTMHVTNVTRDLNVTQRGSGTITIDKLDVFAMFVETSSNGSIHITGGTSRVVVVSTARDAGFWFAGRTDYATVTAVDSSTVSIAHVINVPQVRYRDTPFVYFDKIGQ